MLWCVSASWLSRAVDQGDRYQSAAGLARPGCGAGRPRGGAWTGDARREPADRCHSSVSDPAGWGVDLKRWQGSYDSADPSRRRAGDDRVSQQAVRAQRLSSVLPATEADAAHGA